MLVCVNGQLVPEENAVVSVFDRGFLYGDALFEAVRVFGGRLFRWRGHFERLAAGAKFLAIRLPFDESSLCKLAEKLIAENAMPDALLRITISRGCGPRGYSPKGADKPFFAISLHAAPPCDLNQPPLWTLKIASVRLPAGEPLSQFKTCNKLPQIMARAEADASGADEALLVNTDGHVVEGSSSNLFWIAGGGIRTPPLSGGILPGVTRGVVQEIARVVGLDFKEENIASSELKDAEGVFLSLTSFGLAECKLLDGHIVSRSPVTQELFQKYWQLVRQETAG